MTSRPHSSRQHQRGTSLLEILVAALLLALGILAMAGMQASAQQMSRVSTYKQEAARIATDLGERIRATSRGVAPAPFNLNDYALQNVYNGKAAAVVVPNQCQGIAANCSPAQMAQRDVAEAREQARRALPNGGLIVTPGVVVVGGVNFPVADIWVAWQVPASTDVTNTVNELGCPAGLVTADPATTRCLLTRVAIN